MLELSDEGVRQTRSRNVTVLFWSEITNFQATRDGELLLGSKKEAVAWRLPAHRGAVESFISEVCRRAPQLRFERFVERRGRVRLLASLVAAIAMVSYGFWVLLHSTKPTEKLGSLAMWLVALL